MRLSRLSVLVCALGLVLVVAAPALALTRAQADAVARSALGPQAAGKYAALDGLPAALPAGASISEAGPGPGESWTVSEVGGTTQLRAAIPATRLTAPGWLFWEAPRAGANFPHASTLLLVDNKTGKVAWKKTLAWWPLVNDRAAAFYAHSNKAAYRVTASAGAISAIRFPHDCVVALVDLTDPRPTANFPGDGEAMLALADSFGMRSAIVGSIPDFVAATDKLIAEGCNDVVVFIGGHGTPASGPGETAEPTVILSTAAEPADGGTQTTVADQVLTATDLKNFVATRQSKASFKFLINSCFSGRFVEELEHLPGVVLVETASAADETSIQSFDDDTAADHPLESGTWVAELTEEFRHVVGGEDPTVDAADLSGARRDLATALTVTADHGHDKAAGRGLTHPVSTGVLATPATPATYDYNVTVKVVATGDSFVDGSGVPGANPTYSGSMASTFTFSVPYAFSVDPKAKTVAASLTAAANVASNGSGVDSFTLTGADPGQPSDTCTVPPNTAFKGFGSLSPIWGGQPDAKTYTAGVMLFSLSMEPLTSAIYPCSLSNAATRITITVEGGYSIPGAKLTYVDLPPSTNPSYPNPGCVSGPTTAIYVPIAVSDLGAEHMTFTYNPGPIMCQSTFLGAFYTAHVVYTITLDRT